MPQGPPVNRCVSGSDQDGLFMPRVDPTLQKRAQLPQRFSAVLSSKQDAPWRQDSEQQTGTYISSASASHLPDTRLVHLQEYTLEHLNDCQDGGIPVSEIGCQGRKLSDPLFGVQVKLSDPKPGARHPDPCSSCHWPQHQNGCGALSVVKPVSAGRTGPDRVQDQSVGARLPSLALEMPKQTEMANS